MRRPGPHHVGMNTTETAATTANAPARLPDTTRLGAVHITVTDLDRSFT